MLGNVQYTEDFVPKYTCESLKIFSTHFFLHVQKESSLGKRSLSRKGYALNLIVSFSTAVGKVF